MTEDLTTFMLTSITGIAKEKRKERHRQQRPSPSGPNAC